MGSGSSVKEICYLRGFFHHPGNRPGTVMTRGDLVYVPIPKCGTHTFKQGFSEAGFKGVDNFHDGHHNYNAMAVIREPVDRWISGCVQYWRTFYEDGQTDDQYRPGGVDHWGNRVPAFEEFVDESKEFLLAEQRPRINDAHVIPQAYYLSAVEVDRFIRMDEHLERNVQDWLGEDISLSRLNAGSDALHQTFLDSLTPIHHRILAEFYYEDEQIWNGSK
jgi:hypothetical protein